ncbi:hypothetical protein G6O69_18460 [Pseudenhygromyxa sp. WMMC2535]|uniref:hypothetical protein n=1 Tax=Pseudenhygromyxa sp. WMMC2535 TaxID=2712867 RepID=UPI0015564930|nr:hypothetical protein [Pseudenhygromyxa sp. WMMC2535]NVB39832.1 hypothetical protein [Pseudenhygromyxa sp. WMMC2535]
MIDPYELERTVAALRQQYQRGQPVAQTLLELERAVSSALDNAPDEVSTTALEARSCKVARARDMLGLGELAAPIGADDELRALAEEFRNSVLTRPVCEQFESRLDAYIERARTASERKTQLEAEVEAIDAQLELHRAFLGLLDALIGHSVNGDGT